MNSLTISVKLYLGFGVLVLFLMAISIYAIAEVDSVYESSERDAVRLQALSEVEHLATKGFLYWEQSLEGRANRSATEAVDQWTFARSVCEVMINGGKTKGMVFVFIKESSLRTEIQQLSDSFDEIVIQSKTLSGDSHDLRMAYEKSLQMAERAKASINAKSNTNSAQNIYEEIQTNLIFGSIVIILIGIIISITTSRSIIIPITTVAALMKRDGVKAQLKTKSNDEIGQLTSAVNTFLISFRELVREVVDASSAVSKSSPVEISRSARKRWPTARKISLAKRRMSLRRLKKCLKLTTK